MTTGGTRFIAANFVRHTAEVDPDYNVVVVNAFKVTLARSPPDMVEPDTARTVAASKPV